MEKLYTEIETLKAERETIMRKAEIKVEEARAKLMEEMSEKRSRIESDAYDRGRTDAVGLSLSLKERMAMLSRQNVILTGGCEAIGRGNRIDRINLDGYGASVKYWLTDPTNLSIAGVVATDDKLMEMKDGAVLEVRCYGGGAKMIPSLEVPTLGKDGKFHTSESTDPQK
jgi:hypothetical protein